MFKANTTTCRRVDSIGCRCEITRETAIIFGAAKSSARRTRRINTRLVVILPSPIASSGNISRCQHRGAKPARLSTPLCRCGPISQPPRAERRRLKSYSKLSGPSLYAHWQATGGGGGLRVGQVLTGPGCSHAEWLGNSLTPGQAVMRSPLAGHVAYCSVTRTHLFLDGFIISQAPTGRVRRSQLRLKLHFACGQKNPYALVNK